MLISLQNINKTYTGDAENVIAVDMAACWALSTGSVGSLPVRRARACNALDSDTNSADCCTSKS